MKKKYLKFLLSKNTLRQIKKLDYAYQYRAIITKIINILLKIFLKIILIPLKTMGIDGSQKLLTISQIKYL